MWGEMCQLQIHGLLDVMRRDNTFGLVSYKISHVVVSVFNRVIVAHDTVQIVTQLFLQNIMKFIRVI